MRSPKSVAIGRTSQRKDKSRNGVLAEAEDSGVRRAGDRSADIAEATVRVDAPTLRPTEGPSGLEERELRAIRRFLIGQCDKHTTVELLLRGDLSLGLAIQQVEGRVLRLIHGADGRQRVVVEVSPDAERVVPLERILRAQSRTT